ncbi:MAG: hypothetical protein KC776_21365 [Myxococcales bacterium]|nr:hypothetical protein [Myxococcales bacterium]MCB9581491.1 hypothetical protein [Polyangiaceae bacterium]
MTRVFLLFSVLLVACGSAHQEQKAPQAAVVVPEAADAGSGSAAPPPRVSAPAPAPRDDGVRASVRVEVTNDGGVVQLHSTPDAGVKVWGTAKRTDGGFTFQGGFSFGNADAGP